MELTPFQKAGYKPKDEFIVIDKIEGCVNSYADKRAVLVRDDGTDQPLFDVFVDGIPTPRFIRLSEIKKA